jgi:hypothetical protein
MTDIAMARAPVRTSSILRTAMARVMTAREREARDYLSRKFPALDRDPFSQTRERRESLFEVTGPARA